MRRQNKKDMKKYVYTLFVLLAVVVASCNNYETYGDKKEKERNAIAEYIRKNDITVISESQFKQQDSTTDVSKNEYVYLEKTGIYMQIVRKGSGYKLPEKQHIRILCRFTEFNIINDTTQLSNEFNARYLDIMSVYRTGNTITGSFESGLMYSAYGTASVPNAFLVPFQYINIGRPLTDTDNVAQVKMIVPHTQGQAYAQQNVYPCFYRLTLVKSAVEEDAEK